MVEHDVAPRVDQVDRSWPIDDRHRRVEHLEHPLEADEGGHQVDPSVRQAVERLVDAGDERGQRDERAGRDLTRHDELGADAVDDRRADGADQSERDEEHPAVHRRAHTDVAHPAGPVGERAHLVVVAAEQLHEQRTAHVETLGHLGVHLGVKTHLLA